MIEEFGFWRIINSRKGPFLSFFYNVNTENRMTHKMLKLTVIASTRRQSEEVVARAQYSYLD